MLCCGRVSCRYGTEKFRDRKNDRNNSSVWVFSVCLEPYMFSSIFYKVLDIIIVLFYSWVNKHEKVQLTVQDCTAQEWESSDSDPTILTAGFPISPPLPLPVGYCLFVTATILHSLFHCPEHTCCQLFLNNFIHRCLPLGKVFQQLAINTF